jgi:N-acetylglucosamine kinase-like BadF-type ATPase
MKKKIKTMILLADSGSTKTDWCLVNQEEVVLHVHTKGINPFFQDTAEIATMIGEQLVPALLPYSEQIEGVYFYGAGCAFPEKNKLVEDAIAQYITCSIEVGSDLLGMARALCGKKSGIACIIGTGSNSCYYNGKDIVDNVSPLGFILGDEGSGAVLGKLLVSDCLKYQLTPSLEKAFFDEFKLTRADILDRVYKQPFPNRFLASLSPFLLKHIGEPSVYALVARAFKDFFIRNVMHYDYQKHTVYMVGSIAYYYQEVIHTVAEELGIQLGEIKKSPMDGLINYHIEEYKLIEK